MPGIGIPRCQLKVEFKGKGEKTPVLKDITLHGAKHPHNIFTIDLSNFCNTGMYSDCHSHTNVISVHACVR